MRTLTALLGVLFLALAVRVAVTGLRGFSRPPEKDERNYTALAENLAEGRGFFFEVTRTVSGEPVTRRFTALRPPLYPAVLAGLEWIAGESVLARRLLSCVLGALAAGLLLLWARRILPPAGALLAALLLAVWPSHVWASGQILSEPLYLVLVLGFAASLQSKRHLLAGVLLGLAVLARPAGLLLLLPGAVFVVRRGVASGRMRPLLLLAVPALLIPMPWALRNAGIHGRLLLTTNLGVTFLGGNSDASLDADVPGRWHLPEEILSEDPPDLGYYGWSTLREAESDRRFLRHGLGWVRENPGRWLRLLLAKTLRFFDPDQHSTQEDRALKRWGGWLSFGPLLPFGALGFLLLGGWTRRMTLVTGLVACQLLTVLVFYGDARFRLPAIPAFLILGAAGMRCVVARLQAARGASGGRRAA